MGIRKLKSVLEHMGFDDLVVKLEKAPGSKVGGYVISEHFEGMTQAQRQKYVWDYLEGQLQDDELKSIIAILTMTPEETADARN